MAGRGITSLGDLRKANGGDKDDKKKKANTLYTGGALSGSGQNVIGPGHDDDDSEDGDAGDAVDRVFKQQGVGDGASASVVIKFWKNGFTVDDGDVRPTEENKAFIDAINRGEVPAEVQESFRARGIPGGEVDVKVEDHRGEEWKAPPYRAFSGAGASLGGVGPAPTSAVVRGGGAGAKGVIVDPSQPTTTIAVKLLDGRRERIVLNLSNTVGELQALVAALNGSGGKPFLLSAGFPPKPLAFANVTIEVAGLKGAAVTQQAA